MRLKVKEQRVCVKFGFFLGKTAIETVTMLKEALKDKSVSKHKCIYGLIISKEVKCLLKTNNVVAPPSTCRNDENVEKVHQSVLEDCCLTIDEISEI
jgi:hypothetical protein